ncbi:MAG: hypothetical protein MUF71_00010 [Candidatus Kapabacteria bacterium]|nr:hypothetical protein [Candidatus Kapabacteria bacterium]
MTIALQVEFHSSLIWRGIALERLPVAQAQCRFGVDKFHAAFFGTQALGNGFNATVLQIGYTIETNWGSFVPTLTDYYFPMNRKSWFWVNNDGTGAHTLEGAFLYTAPKGLPIQVFAAMNIFNDPRFSSYIEASYTTSLAEVETHFFVGALLTSNSMWYSSPYSLIQEQGGISSLGVRARYSVPISDRWSLPISVSFILNPNAQYASVVASVALR